MTDQAPSARGGRAYVVWGPELSPFLLKLEALLRYAGAPFRRLPRDGGRWETLRTARRVAAARRARTALRPPRPDPLDELPLVPFLLTPAGAVLYDSSSTAGARSTTARCSGTPTARW